MSESTKAVFLSYASQDAEAAHCLAESLRASDVDVWFDAEGGLEHGDEWDAKIRRQIKECVLFIALISKNTQARHEGYFRIEWDLAAERARGIASGVAFILPIVIDDTREPDALVPDRFRSVQWTKLPGGMVLPDVQARFLKLWSHRTGVLKHEVARTGTPIAGLTEVGPGLATPATVAKFRPWFIPAIFGFVAVAALVVWRPWKDSDSRSLASSSSPPGSSLTPFSESRQLVAKAWDLMSKPEMARAELNAADELCKRGVALQPNDAEVWAAWAYVNGWYVFHNLDRSPARREAARNAASRAMQLDPGSYEARLAQAFYWVRCQYDAPSGPEAVPILRQLLQERPDEPRALFSLGFMLAQQSRDTLAEGNTLLERLAKNPRFAAVAWDEYGWMNFFHGDYKKGEVGADRSLAVQPYWNNLGLKITLAERVHGDMEMANSLIARMPASALQEDFGIGFACEVYQWRREPLRTIHLLEDVSRDWIHYFFADYPKAFLFGEARLMAGQETAAKRDFQRAVELIDKELVDDPNNISLLGLKARSLHFLGDREAAKKCYQLVKELGGQEFEKVLFESPEVAIAYLRASAGDGSSVTPNVIWKMYCSPASLRLDPHFDSLRNVQAFQALIAELEASTGQAGRATHPPENGEAKK